MTNTKAPSIPRTIPSADLTGVTGGCAACPGGGGQARRPGEGGAQGIADSGAGIAGKAGHR